MPFIKRLIRLSAILSVALLWLLVATGNASAAVEPYQQKIEGKLKKNDTLLVKDEKFENPVYNWNTIRNNSVYNVITFRMNTDALAAINKPFSCKADLKVEYWSQPGQDLPITLEHVKLDINYDTTAGAVYQAAAQYELQNAYKIKITINDISSSELPDLPAAFTLEAKVIVDRDYLPQGDQTLIPTVTLNTDDGNEGGMAARSAIEQTPNSVTINWDVIPGSQKYDLEWTFIDEESANGDKLAQAGTGASTAILAPMFRNNSSRITVAGNTYVISLVHNSKYLLLRMRTVDESGGYRNEGSWSYQIKADGVVTSAVILLNNSWHQPGLNWQYNATYAEDGKKKEIVSYFDGTLRNRQTVTVNSSDMVSVVQENVYDQFGRPVANILPAPAGSGLLTYFPAFNRNTSGTAYTYNNIFKGLTGNCIGVPDMLKSDTGAAKYFSANNRFLSTDPFNKYIPDAEGYPFAVTAYTPDNTGRVALKGGVGAAFQPNSSAALNHTTRYYYGKPEQWELDRLFGNDAGFADHYLKNMVIDPNGQISISYQNAAGKTVATALSGNPPDTALLALPSKPAPVQKEIVLLQPERFVFDPSSLKLTATTTYLAAIPDPAAAFKFSMDRLIKKYVQNGVTICSNCYYEMKVTVSDDCNNKIVDINKVKTGSELSDCNKTGTYDTTFTAAFSKIGEYYITFELVLNPQVIEAYTNDFITRNTNLKTQFQFVMEQLKKEDFSGCFSECTTCKDALGEKPAFMLALKTRMFQDGVDTVVNLAAINSWAGGLYDALYSNCQQLRTTCLLSPCDLLRRIMAQDVSPGGQYALFDANGNALESDINVISRFWRDAFPPKPAGDSDYEATKFQLDDSTYTSPYDQSFTLPLLLKYWQPEWGDKFVDFHPESCALRFCNDHANYKAWDQRLEQIYSTNADIPLIKAGLAYSTTNGSWLLGADQFFATGGKGAAYIDSFKADLDNYSSRILHVTDARLNNKSLSQYVDYLLYCADSTGSTNTSSNADGILRWNQCAPVATCRIPDRQWQLYANLYLEVKEKYYQQLRNTSGYCKDKCVIGAAPVIDRANAPKKPEPYRTCADFDASMFQVTIGNRTITVWPPALPIPQGLKIWVSVLTDDLTYVVWFTAGQGAKTVATDRQIPQIISKAISCEGTPVTPPNPCPIAYWDKKSRVNNYKYDEPVSADTTQRLAEARAALALQIERSCSVTIDNWLNKLSGCTKYDALPDATKATLRARLTEICTLGGDMDHIYGSSTTLGGKTNTDGDASFAQVLKRYLNITSFDTLCNPWRLDVPYPANVKAQTVSRTISVTDASICTKLNALKLEQQTTQPGATFYNFLVAKYGKGMTITAVELDALLKGCTNCRYLLDRDIKLPVFLDGTAKGCITATEFWAARSSFKTAITNVGDTTLPNYKNIYRNYLNQQWGFTLSFSDYDNYRKLLQTNPAETLCNSPVYSTVKIDPYNCMYMLIDGAVAGGKRAYTYYIDSVKQDFRKQYVDVCGSVRSKVNLTTSQQIYHYTLYYYDQAGNLLRTVPPEGVDLIEDPAVYEQIDQNRRLDFSQCNYTGPTANTNPDTTLNRLGTTLTTANQSMEMWLYNTDGDATNVVTPAGDKAFLNVCLDGTYLSAEVYKLGPPTAGTVDLVASNSITVNIGALLPLKPWTHVVIQGPDLDSSGVISVFVNGVSCPAVSNAPATGCGWDISIAGNGSLVFTQNLSYLRQLRLYKRLMTAAEIAANAKENCLGLAPAYATGLLKDTLSWGRFNTPPAGGPTTWPGAGTTEGVGNIYPKHRLTTDYAYNSLGGVSKQRSPDANTSTFFYDVKGRLFASQNANQALGNKQFSYIKYDDLGRIIEVGEKTNAGSLGTDDFVKDANVTLFQNSGTNAQITRTYYDAAILDPNSYPQDNLRNRVSASVYSETGAAGEQASYYSYDISGNVKTLWQQLYGLHEMKRIDYGYDLVSGKVNAVRYQPSKPDQFIYNYKYDAENRLTKAMTGITSVGNNWDISTPATDAYYKYYKHGPLARVVIGEKTVQGIDYAYTLQGWLKTINGTNLTPANDIGQDAVPSAPTATVAKDVMAYSLDYYTGDYKPIGGAAAAALSLKYTTSTTDITGQDLFNGNISRTTVALSKINNGNPVGYSYRYDQLNRLVRMRQHQPAVGANSWGTTQRVEDYKEDISYDANGNILTYLRNGASSTGLNMDALSYNYPRDAAGNLTANTLQYIRDAVRDDAYPSDIDNMAAANYSYDKIGNLVKDVSAGITNITWSVYGKIKSITFNDNSSLSYKYDAAGNRIYKEYLKAGVTSKTWYLRDAQGNTLAVYGNRNGDAQTYWKEQHLYGSSRVGMWMPDMQVTGTAGNPATLWGQTNLTRYELSNHLGNVLATISDLPVSQNATVYNMSDYAPFGMQLTGRKWALGGTYRYGFNGMEKSDEIKGEGNSYTAQFWEYDPRIGRRWNFDPKLKIGESPYLTFSGNPISFKDPLGDSSVFNAKGGVIHYDKKDKDLRVFMKDDKGLKLIGEIGKSINVDVIAQNILNENKVKTETMTDAGWVKKVLPGSEWDYKNNTKTIFGVVWAADIEASTKSGTERRTEFLFKRYSFHGSADFGNYHAGYTGIYTGLSRNAQFWWAGMGEVAKLHDLGTRTRDILTWNPPYGDQDEDHSWNIMGMTDAENEIQKNGNPGKVSTTNQILKFGPNH